jgi:hypothetical protein
MTVRRLEDGGERNAMMEIKCRIRDRIGDAGCCKRNNWVMPRLEWRGIVSGWRPLIYVIGGAMERVRGDSVFNNRHCHVVLTKVLVEGTLAKISLLHRCMMIIVSLTAR